MKTLITLILFCAATVQAQVLIYKRTIHRTHMGNGFTMKDTTTGYLMLEVNSGSAAEFDIDSVSKCFLNRSKTFTTGIVRAGHGKNHIVLGDAVSGSDILGPYESSLTGRGTTALVDIGLAEKQSVARTLRLIGREVYFLLANLFIDEQTGTLVIDLAATREANSAGKTLDEIVTAMRSTLVESGYKDAHP